jgi:membrane protein YqaA with SNARE-associated domain
VGTDVLTLNALCAGLLFVATVFAAAWGSVHGSGCSWWISTQGSGARYR